MKKENPKGIFLNVTETPYVDAGILTNLQEVTTNHVKVGSDGKLYTPVHFKVNYQENGKSVFKLNADGTWSGDVNKMIEHLREE